MNLADFKSARARRAAEEKAPRPHCLVCRNPKIICYCGQISPVESDFHFVILIHRAESRRSVATGRMAHLCLKNSTLLEGTDFTRNATLNALLQDPAGFPVMLYPGPAAVNLSRVSLEQRRAVFPAGKRPLVVIIDGTWSQAKRIKRLSTNLRGLPQIAFTPTRPSRFRVRRQPREECYSTIEAAEHLLHLLEPERGHQEILRPFAWLVAQQISFSGPPGTRPRRR